MYGRTRKVRSAEAWLETLEINEKEWPGYKMLAQSKILLKGTAARWFRALKSKEIQTCKNLKNYFLRNLLKKKRNRWS